MRLNLLKVGSFSSRPKRVVWGAVVLVVILLVGWGLRAKFYHSTNKQTAKTVSDTVPPDYIIKSVLTSANQKAQTNDFNAVIDLYLGATNVAIANKDYEKAKAILKECINTVPDKSVTALVYFNLADVAKPLKDETLEKSSLQKALSRANQPNSGISKFGVDYINKRLAELK